MSFLRAVPDPRRARLERDLPVAWDDEPVTWGDPVAVGAVFLCPPPRIPDACTQCGQLRDDGTDGCTGTVPQLEPAYWTRDREGRSKKVPSRTVRHLRLYLTRCLGCGHDQVLDLDTDETWDLDDSDYGPSGSVHPDLLQGRLL